MPHTIFDRISQIGTLSGQRRPQQPLLSFATGAAPELEATLPLDVLDATRVPTPEEETPNRFRDFVLRAGGGRPSLLNTLSAAFGQGTEEIAARKRAELLSRLEEAETRARIQTLNAPTQREILADVTGRQRFLDTGEPVFPEVGADPGLDLRRRELALSESREERLATELSAGAETALLESQELVISSQRSANTMDNLASEFERAEPIAGAAASITEFLKGALGTEDDVSAFRRQYNGIRASQAIQNLPPGVASDKDIELALSGFPRANANAEQISGFLRGAAKLARAVAGWNAFKSDFLSEEGTPRGLTRAWRQKINVPSLDREVSMGEIYITAQEENLTIEEVMQQLGIERP